MKLLQWPVSVPFTVTVICSIVSLVCLLIAYLVCSRIWMKIIWLIAGDWHDVVCLTSARSWRDQVLLEVTRHGRGGWSGSGSEATPQPPPPSSSSTSCSLSPSSETDIYTTASTMSYLSFPSGFKWLFILIKVKMNVFLETFVEFFSLSILCSWQN